MVAQHSFAKDNFSWLFLGRVFVPWGLGPFVSPGQQSVYREFDGIRLTAFSTTLGRRTWGESWLVGEPPRPMAVEESGLATKQVDNPGIMNTMAGKFKIVSKPLAQAGAGVLQALLKG